MQQKNLMAALGACAFFAFSPVLPWLTGRLFTSLDEAWVAFLGNLAYTVPIGLGIAAIVLAVHGLITNAIAVEELEEQFALAGVASTSAGGTQAATAEMPLGTPEAESPARGGKMAVRERPDEGFKKDKDGKKRKSGGRAKARIGFKARTAVRRQIRNRF